MTLRFWGTDTTADTPDGTNHFAPAVGALSDGGYVVAWQNAASGASFQRFDAFGNPVGSVTDLPVVYKSGLGGFQSDLSVTGLADGNFIVGFQDDNGSNSPNTAAEEFDSSGNFLKTYFIDSTVADTSAPATASYGNGWVEATESGGNIYFATGTSNGTLGAAKAVNTLTTANSDQPAVAT